MGTGFGPRGDFLDAEAVVRLDSLPAVSLGFQLRPGPEIRHDRGMFALLRDALADRSFVELEYELAPGRSNGRLLSVARPILPSVEIVEVIPSAQPKSDPVVTGGPFEFGDVIDVFPDPAPPDEDPPKWIDAITWRPVDALQLAAGTQHVASVDVEADSAVVAEVSWSDATQPPDIDFELQGNLLPGSRMVRAAGRRGSIRIGTSLTQAAQLDVKVRNESADSIDIELIVGTTSSG